MGNPKEAAGRAAARLVQDGMTVGLGTGSTVHFTLLELSERIREERIAIRGVPTSLDTEAKAKALGIPLVGLEEVERIDLTIDGADEIDAHFDMIKGGGGALLREKVIASISTREAIVVGADKVVARLGTTFPLPVEVVPFALPVVRRALIALGTDPVLRTRAGETVRTDNGNWILDARFPRGIEDATALERRLAQTPGVVESGLFIGLAQLLFVGNADGTCTLREKPRA